MKLKRRSFTRQTNRLHKLAKLIKRYQKEHWIQEYDFWTGAFKIKQEWLAYCEEANLPLNHTSHDLIQSV